MKNQRLNIREAICKGWMMLMLSMVSSFSYAQENVGIGTLTPLGKLHIVGSADNSQLIITANSTQSNTKPLICLKDKFNQDLMWIHSDDGTNCFVGRLTGKVNTGADNSFFGNMAGENNTHGFGNTALGARTLVNNDSGDKNIAVGDAALFYNYVGDENIAMGYNSLYYNTTGNENVAIGEFALYTNKAGNECLAIGQYAMANANDQTSSFYPNNMAIGYRALYGSPTTANNTGTNNTAIGNSSMESNSSGHENTTLGYNTLKENTTGYQNTATGSGTLEKNTTGYQNTATGSNAMKNNTAGLYNCANGFQALNSNTTGDGNTAIGSSALFSNTIGDNNTGMGRGAYFTANNLSNTTSIGYLSGGNVNASNRIEIGNTSVSWVGGQMNWGTYSDGRIKDDIREDVPGLDFVNRLRPVTYNLNIHRQNELISGGSKAEEDTDWQGKYDIEQIRMTGFIAQEVEQAAKESAYDFSGVQKPLMENELYSLRYAEFVMPLVKSVQELSHENLALKNEIKAQKDDMIELKNKLDAQELMIAAILHKID